MKNVTLAKAELIAVITSNQLTHNQEYAEMMQAFKVEVATETKAMIEFNASREKDFRTSIDVREPMSHNDEYDRILSMLNMSVDDNITLSQEEYRQYVLDEWSWAGMFAMSKTRYLN